MKVFCGLGFTIRLAFFCLVAGIVLGLYLGVTAADRVVGRDAGSAASDSGHLRWYPAPGSAATSAGPER